jgi:colicin import membrane protein
MKWIAAVFLSFALCCLVVVSSFAQMPQSEDSPASDLYAVVLANAIQRNWYYPVIKEAPNLATSVDMTIGEDGKILSSTIVKSSNNPEFDRSVLHAIELTEFVEKPRTERDRLIHIIFNSKESPE